MFQFRGGGDRQLLPCDLFDPWVGQEPHHGDEDIAAVRGFRPGKREKVCGQVNEHASEAFLVFSNRGCQSRGCAMIRDKGPRQEKAPELEKMDP